ncbi:hypothetical protein [Glutamicibacter arilaitensis]|uniref:hypothetical protein n=1 Tax=Glutamicibacter arilaitensis TaxID=256701 RepID=UPI00384CC0A3
MGANEKLQAAMHGGAGAPVTESVRERYMHDRYVTDGVEPVRSRAEFDRWLEGVRAEAKAEAYKDAANVIHAEARWQSDLKNRHNEYRFTHCADRMTEMENVMVARANQYKEEVNGR